MAKQLKDILPPGFSSMSQEEKLAFIAQVRASRTSPKATSKIVQKAKKQVRKKVETLADKLKGLSPEELALILGD